MERARQTEMTSLYFSFQARLAQLRATGEIPPKEYGTAVGPSEFLRIIALPVSDVRIRGLKNLLLSKRLYGIESCQ
jgi:hypothetical protein